MSAEPGQNARYSGVDEHEQMTLREEDHVHPKTSHTAASSSRITLQGLSVSDYALSAADWDEIQDEDTRRMFPFLLPPPLGTGFAVPPWDLAREEPIEGWDPDVEARLTHFHNLKKQGIHFNESLMANQSFNNPHIYSHLVEFVDIDETRSHMPDLLGPGAWNPHDPDVLKEGDPYRITRLQEEAEEEREVRQKRAQKRSIGFVHATTDPREPGTKSNNTTRLKNGHEEYNKDSAREHRTRYRKKDTHSK